MLDLWQGGQGLHHSLSQGMVFSWRSTDPVEFDLQEGNETSPLGRQRYKKPRQCIDEAMQQIITREKEASQYESNRNRQCD